MPFTARALKNVPAGGKAEIRIDDVIARKVNRLLLLFTTPLEHPVEEGVYGEDDFRTSMMILLKKGNPIWMSMWRATEG
jgi:hypothetical protein